MVGTNQPTTETDERSEGILGEAESRGVTLRSVRKEFGDLVAVDGIDLDVRAGELLVLLGPSGCGKTTTLRMIAGLETVTSGTIHMGETEVTETLPQNRDISMVFQNYALYPHKTVRENLAFPLGKLDLSDEERDERIVEVATLLEIDPLLEKDPDQLSGGQRQRVAVGRTIIREPELFLMDEPLSNLDAKLRVQTRAEISRLQRRLGTTTVYVTHDQEEALSIADRIVIMNDGEIEQIGTPEQVYTQPANEFVAGFLGEPSMNFLDVTDGALFGGSVPVGFELPAGTRRIGVRPEDARLARDSRNDESMESEQVDERTDGITRTAVKDTMDPSDRGSSSRSPTGDDSEQSAPLEFTLDVIEPLGHTYEVTLHRDGARFVLQAPSIDAAPGDTVSVHFTAEDVLAFDSEGVRL